MITPSTSSHWYYPDGTPAYEKTLRDARKEPLAPSVTQVLGIIGKPMVDAWAVNLMSETCWQNPCYWVDNEPLDAYRARIEPIYDARRKEAAIRGSAIHDYAEACINGQAARPVEGYERQCELIAEWIAETIASATAEECFAHDCKRLAYGGRIDAHGFLKDGRRFVLDFKTQDLKGKARPNYYEEWSFQLGAYKLWLDETRCTVELGPKGLKVDRPPHVAMSVVIDTGDIQKIHVKEYSDDDMAEAQYVFGSILAAWYAIKGL
ncbi:MAG: hypothetical protein C0436_00180 [Alphaproteobacteria bacterium]|nr:hypothetical protein [Alphaproteobacteria bacterium]